MSLNGIANLRQGHRLKVISTGERNGVYLNEVMVLFRRQVRFDRQQVATFTFQLLSHKAFHD